MCHQSAGSDKKYSRLPRIAIPPAANFPRSTGLPFQLLGRIFIIQQPQALKAKDCANLPFLFQPIVKSPYEDLRKFA